MSVGPITEAQVLWFLQTCDGPVLDLKEMLEVPLRDTVDDLERKGLITKAWVLTEAGQELADKAWKELRSKKQTFVLNRERR